MLKLVQNLLINSKKQELFLVQNSVARKGIEIQSYQPDFLLVLLHTTKNNGPFFLPVTLYTRSKIFLLDIPNSSIFLANVIFENGQMRTDWIEILTITSVPFFNFSKILSDVNSFEQLIVITDEVYFCKKSF